MPVEDIISWMRDLPAWGVYAFLLVSSVIENLFPPWPGDTISVFGGFLAAQNTVTLPLCFLSILIGNMLGAYTMYFAGESVLDLARRVNAKITRPIFLSKWMSEITSEEHMDRARSWFARWGLWFVLLSRFSAGIRFFVSIIAGISRMNFVLFSVAFALGVLIWNVLLLGGGYALGDNWRLIVEAVRVYSGVLSAIIGLLVIFYVIWRIRKARRQRASVGTAQNGYNQGTDND
ncbi:MAG: DedA family protein [Leptospiraceae bacterium]|nr:DedA family protein [Leptospiraceae bacterium]